MFDMKIASLILFCIIFFACNNDSAIKTTTRDSSMTPNDSSTGQWISLFDGASLAGWHGFNKQGEIRNWRIEDGAMVCLGAAEGDIGGDIVSDREFADFELNWEWKITTGGNSGVMYHVIESPQYKAPYETGPEYQVLDDVGFPEKLESWQLTAADYAMYSPDSTRKKLKPVGEWNSSKIVFKDSRVEHWLNEELVLSFEAWSDDWTRRKTEGKWKDFPDYGSAKKGRIALQDHGNKVYYRNIRIREL